MFEIKKDIDENITKSIIREIYKLNYYKKGLDYLKKISRPVVLDLGAYIGITADYFNVNNADIYAVEANPLTYDCLVENTKPYKNILSILGAVGVTDKKRAMYSDNKTVAMSLIKCGYATTPVLEVEGMTFGQLFGLINKKIDFLKIDIEGAEYELFLSESFKRLAHNINYIIGEAHEDPVAHYFLPEILKRSGFKTKFLKNKNFVRTTFYELGDIKDTIEVKISTNFIATRI